MNVLERIAAASPALAPYVVPAPPTGEFEDRLADPERALALEAVREGYLLHYGEPRLYEGMDADLRLLAGDALYALGLEHLAEAGDLAAVVELADLISLCAWARASERPELEDGLWEASAAALSPAGGAGARAAVEPLLDGGGPGADSA